MKFCGIIISKYLLSCFIRLQGKLSFYDSESVESSVYMCINCEIGSIGRNSQVYFCCFDSYSGKFCELLYRFWYFSAIYIYDIEAGLVYIFRFSSKESDSFDMFSDLIFSHIYTVLWSFQILEKGFVYFIYSFICSLC